MFPILFLLLYHHLGTYSSPLFPLYIFLFPIFSSSFLLSPLPHYGLLQLFSSLLSPIISFIFLWRCPFSLNILALMVSSSSFKTFSAPLSNIFSILQKKFHRKNQSILRSSRGGKVWEHHFKNRNWDFRLFCQFSKNSLIFKKFSDRDLIF